MIPLLFAVAAATPSDVPTVMHTQFALVMQGRAAVAKGDLPAAREAGRQLVELEPPEGLTDPWRPYVAELKADAAGLAAADSLDIAATEVATLALSCASCHQAKGGGPALPDPTTLDLSDGSRRDVGLDLLWLSLLTGSGEAWDRGVAALEEADAPPWSLVSAEGDEARARAFAKLLVAR